MKEECEPDRLAVLFGDQRFRIRPFAEQVGRELSFRHRDLVLELFVAGEAPDQSRDQGHVCELARPDAKGHLGRSRRRKTKRIAPCVSEKLAILLSTRPAASPASMRSVSLSGPRPPLTRTTQTAPLGSIQVFTSFNFSRSRISFAPRKTMSHGNSGLPRTMSDVRERRSLTNAGSSRLTTATFAPGFTPSLSSSGLVDATSGLSLFLPRCRRESRRRRGLPTTSRHTRRRWPGR